MHRRRSANNNQFHNANNEFWHNASNALTPRLTNLPRNALEEIFRRIPRARNAASFSQASRNVHAATRNRLPVQFATRRLASNMGKVVADAYRTAGVAQLGMLPHEIAQLQANNHQLHGFRIHQVTQWSMENPLYAAYSVVLKKEVRLDDTPYTLEIHYNVQAPLLRHLKWVQNDQLVLKGNNNANKGIVYRSISQPPVTRHFVTSPASSARFAEAFALMCEKTRIERATGRLAEVMLGTH